RHGDGGRIGVRTVQGAETVQSPQCMDDSDIQADLVHGWIAGYLDQGRQYVLLPPFDEEPLRVPAPEKVGVLERLDQLLRRGAGKGERCLLPLRPSFSVVND